MNNTSLFVPAVERRGKFLLLLVYPSWGSSNIILAKRHTEISGGLANPHLPHAVSADRIILLEAP